MHNLLIKKLRQEWSTFREEYRPVNSMEEVILEDPTAMIIHSGKDIDPYSIYNIRKPN